MKRENIEKPSVTLIVPVYNGESSICACMDSIVNQTLKKILQLLFCVFTWNIHIYHSISIS